MLVLVYCSFVYCLCCCWFFICLLAYSFAFVCLFLLLTVGSYFTQFNLFFTNIFFYFFFLACVWSSVRRVGEGTWVETRECVHVYVYVCVFTCTVHPLTSSPTHSPPSSGFYFYFFFGRVCGVGGGSVIKKARG